MRLFETEAEISNDIWEHMRYPEHLFKIQSDILLRYHVDSPEAFYTACTGRFSAL